MVAEQEKQPIFQHGYALFPSWLDLGLTLQTPQIVLCMYTEFYVNTSGAFATILLSLLTHLSFFSRMFVHKTVRWGYFIENF